MGRTDVLSSNYHYQTSSTDSNKGNEAIELSLSSDVFGIHASSRVCCLERWCAAAGVGILATRPLNEEQTRSSIAQVTSLTNGRAVLLHPVGRRTQILTSLAAGIINHVDLGFAFYVTKVYSKPIRNALGVSQNY